MGAAVVPRWVPAELPTNAAIRLQGELQTISGRHHVLKGDISNGRTRLPISLIKRGWDMKV